MIDMEYIAVEADTEQDPTDFKISKYWKESLIHNCLGRQEICYTSVLFWYGIWRNEHSVQNIMHFAISATQVSIWKQTFF